MNGWDANTIEVLNRLADIYTQKCYDGDLEHELGIGCPYCKARHMINHVGEELQDTVRHLRKKHPDWDALMSERSVF